MIMRQEWQAKSPMLKNNGRFLSKDWIYSKKGNFDLTSICICPSLEVVCFSFRHASRFASPERTKDEERLSQQTENLVHYIESWLTLAKELIHQQEQLMIDSPDMIDGEKTFHGSFSTSDNDLTNHNLLCQLKVCSTKKN